MTTENFERKQAERPYICDNYCNALMVQTKRKIYDYNNFDFSGDDWWERLGEKARGILGKAGKNITILPPFHCDYGTNIEIGDNFFANYNFVVLDVAKVTIGDNVFVAPNVSIYTAGHPIHPKARNSMYEYGISVTIGSDCWLGGNAVICPGVTIGSGTVIGAGSVVTHDIPANVVAAGNPCRVIREITDEDIRYYFKNREFTPEELSRIMEK